jgi:hypothetical protein
MPPDIDRLKPTLRSWTLFLGVLQVTIGCMVGFIPPTAVAWFRGIVMAHLEFTANGVLMVVLGLLLREMRLGATALKVWFVALQIGTWSNGASGVAAAFIGTSSKLMTTINEKYPPPHGTDSPVVTNFLQLCGVTIMVALLMTLYGLLRGKDAARDAAG